MKNRITDKKLRDKRFRKTEEAIILAFIEAKERLSPERIIRIAHISRSTLYRHHHSIQDIAPDYEEYILRKYHSFIKHNCNKKGTNCGFLYHRILVFISVNHILIDFLLRFGNQNIIEQMILELNTTISIYEDFSEEIFYIYAKEVSGVIEKWGTGGYSRESITPTVRKITYLTDTALHRLKPLLVHKVC